mgnify:CR=1 FL=1
MRLGPACLCVSLFLVGCGPDCSLDSDGDGLLDCDESDVHGTDPALEDSDGDGESDGAEVDCGSNPLDEAEACYLCGWGRNDPGNLTATGNERGDTIENVNMVDQCREEVPLWDFARDYHVLWMTAAW